MPLRGVGRTLGYPAADLPSVALLHDIAAMNDADTEAAEAQPTARGLRGQLSGSTVPLPEIAAGWLRRARAVDRDLRAFHNLDERLVVAQAARLQALRLRAESLPPLWGVPVAVKDVIDTADFPTGLGSPIHEGRQADADATVVRRLRDAGALVFGKTVSTEFATFTPGPTRNPHDLAHTPGGSSSGSAAAVAAGLVPLAIGTQTNGSVLRPASFCGVYGYKPSMGLIPRTGVFEQSPSLDQLGFMARSVEDLAWAAELGSGDDGHDAASRGLPPRQLLAVCLAEPAARPRLCFAKTPWWDQVEPEARLAYEAFVDLMEGVLASIVLPAIAEPAVSWHATVNEVELAYALRREYQHQAQGLSPALHQRIGRAMATPAMDYLAAKARQPEVARACAEHFADFDALVCPAALGGAPRGLGSTGNPLMQTVWTFAGLPSLSLPLLTLSGGLPLGVQLVGRLHDDARLLRTARWLVREFVDRSQG